jgi:hypothetical protein
MSSHSIAVLAAARALGSAPTSPAGPTSADRPAMPDRIRPTLRALPLAEATAPPPDDLPPRPAKGPDDSVVRLSATAPAPPALGPESAGTAERPSAPEPARRPDIVDPGAPPAPEVSGGGDDQTAPARTGRTEVQTAQARPPAGEPQVPAAGPIATSFAPDVASRGDAELFAASTTGPDPVDRHHAAAVSHRSDNLPQRAEAAALARQMVTALPATPGGVTELLLDPVDLGSLRLVLAPGDGTLIVTVTAERAETSDIIRRNLAELSQEFRSLGYGDVTVALSGEGADDRRKSREPIPQPDPAATETPESAPIMPAGTGRALRGSGLLDVRL